MLKHVNADNFEKEVLKSEKPVLVDFFATWCGPCKMVALVLEKIGQDINTFDVAKIDVDEARDLAIDYGIEVVPTMILFKDGKVINEMSGAYAKDEIIKFVENSLNK